MPRGVYTRKPRLRVDPLPRFMDLVSPEPNSGCWLWTGAVSQGYGRFHLPPHQMVRAHRWIWEHENGPIPGGMLLDHRCRVPSCVNPRHLRVVTPLGNALAEGSLSNAAKDRCKRGHELTPANTYVYHRPFRRCCKTCIMESNDRRRTRALSHD